ncbi:MAG TPA: endonuclease/exonuclease/phosphatase family protein [Usitatibacter sp.]|nr:endonuclease/exonuclease/phosphatase family protein [Usitatibacter sp.]
MKLVTWNIQWGCGVDGRVDLERIVRAARDLADFDVLCVQEVADNFPGLAGNDDSDQFARLSALLPGYTRVDGHGVDVAGDGGRRRRFGNAIFSRLGVLSTRRHALPWPPDPGKKTMPRVAVEATLQASMGPLRLATTHLEYYSDLQKRAQARRLRNLHDEACQRARMDHAYVNNESNVTFDPTPQTANAILTGDFNFPPEHAAYGDITSPLAGGGPAYRDAWVIANGHQPHPPTFCVHATNYARTPYCCDFIFVSSDLARRVRSVSVDVDTRASDHQPVLLELDDH